MSIKCKLSFAFGAALAGIIVFLTVTSFKGKVVEQASSPVSPAVVKVREMQTNPSSLTGLLGIGEVLYRTEYYPSVEARMTACSSLIEESQYAGKKVEVNWLTASVCEVKVDGMVVFRWSGREWQHP